jgi:hypothetical protein
MRLVRLVRLALAAALLVFSMPARAAPWFDSGQDDLADRFAEGDLDEEDLAVRDPGRHGVGASRVEGASSDARGQSWLSVVAFERELLSGRRDLGGIVVVGLALDRIGAGRQRLMEPPSPAPPTARDARPAPAEVRLVAPFLARECVAAALRTSGLGDDDERIDDLVTRARESALLPETRLRAMRLWDDAAHATTLATTNDVNYYDAIGANLVLEVRLTWRLDRWLYAGDEPTLERVRLERQEARTRIATRALEALFAWQRGTAAAELAAVASPERFEARLKAAEAAATLDVLTGGWFSKTPGARTASETPPPAPAREHEPGATEAQPAPSPPRGAP